MEGVKNVAWREVDDSYLAYTRVSAKGCQVQSEKHVKELVLASYL